MKIFNNGNTLKMAAAALCVGLLTACGNSQSNQTQFEEIPDSL